MHTCVYNTPAQAFLSHALNRLKLARFHFTIPFKCRLVLFKCFTLSIMRLMNKTVQDTSKELAAKVHPTSTRYPIMSAVKILSFHLADITTGIGKERVQSSQRRAVMAYKKNAIRKTEEYNCSFKMEDANLYTRVHL